MDNSKLTALPGAITPINGEALIYMVQDGNSVQAAVSEIPINADNLIAAVGVVKGGTGASTADDARTNLGAASQADLTTLENTVDELSVTGLPPFANTAAGIAGTTNGEFFQVLGAEGSPTFTTAYLNNSGVADELSSSPSSAALASAISALRMPAGFPTTNLEAFWAFDDGSGDTVTNVFNPGTLDIDLTLPTNPNFTWTAQGGQTRNGLIQSDIVTGGRTVMIVYQLIRGDESGFTLTGGSGTNHGLFGSFCQPAWTPHIGGGWGVHTPFRHPSNGQSVYEQNRGGWIVEFCDYGAAYNQAVGIGGQINSTSNRSPMVNVAACAIWSGTLTDGDKDTAYEALRQFLIKKDIVLNWQDGAGYYDSAIICGESNPQGEGLISELDAADQTAAYLGLQIMVGDLSSIDYVSPQPFKLGVNQRGISDATKVGYVIGFATSKWANIANSVRDLVALMFSRGTTYLAPTSTGVASGQSWNPDELQNVGNPFYRLLVAAYDADQRCRLSGVGLRMKGVQFGIGLNDATNVAYASSSAVYQGYMQNFYDKIVLYTGLDGLLIHVPRAHNHDPVSNATALANVRAGQAAFVSANSSVAYLMDTDSIPLRPDNVHYTAPGDKTIGADAYTFFGLSNP